MQREGGTGGCKGGCQGRRAEREAREGATREGARENWLCTRGRRVSPIMETKPAFDTSRKVEHLATSLRLMQRVSCVERLAGSSSKRTWHVRRGVGMMEAGGEEGRRQGMQKARKAGGERHAPSLRATVRT